ncbi:DUF6279 family lipoprotein [Marinobacter sp. 2_MG-2023]|uniref:DUF6279 family lipoprotein n=1 Tax=Marinobacter sp. 2_MG-2023 TaxID=3062679 RepID=UPI0026E247A6|nr:DUF6279 family lipoprotein [Marinobacter sp. 2_MG-2023]MDO6441044.1 DUF6279 family lipoprotein [Marinobacter sp. 2_MG-2023]
MDQYEHSFQVRAKRAVILLLVTIFVVSGCSSTKLAYRYADWGIIWWVEDFITLTEPQKQQLNADIDNLKDWHCSTELPRYRSWLDNLQSDLATGDPGPAEVSGLQSQLATFIPPLLNQVAPIATNLLSSLSDEQVRELADNMAEKQQELEKEFLSGSSEQIAKARAERTAERAERWLGSLNGRQQTSINNWSENRAGQTTIWLEGRKHWQEALLEALRERDEPGFDARITDLINNPEAGRGEAYSEMMDTSMEAMTSLIQDLLLASHPSHLDHLARQASKLSGDFKALTCQPGSEVASQALTSR